MIQAARTYQSITYSLDQLVRGSLPTKVKLTPEGETELTIRIDDLVAFIAKISPPLDIRGRDGKPWPMGSADLRKLV